MKALTSVAKNIGYIIAGLIVVSAILISISWLLAPILNKHRQDVAEWVSKLLVMPVTIQSVNISWSHYQPVISLQAVTLHNKETKAPILQIKKVLVFFSLPQSMWQMKPIASGILISGTDLNIHESLNGEFAVQGFPALGGFNAPPYPQESTIKEMMSWLSSQPKIILENIDIRFTDKIGLSKYVTLYELSLINSKTQHVITGKAILHQEIATEVTVAARWLGEEVDLSKIKAKIYLYVSGLSLHQWLPKTTYKGWQIKNSVVSAKVWANWHLGKFRKLQTIFQLYNAVLYSERDKKIHYIDRLSGHFGWKKDAKGQVYAGDDILIDLKNHLWPITRFYIALSANKENSLTPKIINLGFINLEDVQAFLFSTTYLPPNIEAILAKLQLSGNVKNVFLTFPEDAENWYDVSLKVGFDKINFMPYLSYPGIRNLTGTLQWDKRAGNFEFNSRSFLFQYPTIFANSLNLNSLKANIQVKQANNKWLITVLLFQALNNDITFNLIGSLFISKEKETNVDLTANFAMQQAKNLSRYLPLQLFTKTLKSWLQQAFLSGDVKLGKIILKGNLNDFPFDKNNNGIFSVTGMVDDINLKYAPNWPLLENIKGKVSFLGRQMLIDTTYAKIQDIPLSNIHAEIPYIGREKSQVLHVSSVPIKTTFSKGLNFVRQSPLKSTLGKMFAQVSINGPLVLGLELLVPLGDPLKTEVQGTIDLLNTELNTLHWKLPIKNINGVLHFTENSITANQLSALLFEKPITFNLETIRKAQALAIVQAVIKTPLTIKDLENWLHVSLSNVIKGTTNVNAIINLSPAEPVKIHINSNLIGVSVNLASDLGKKSEEARNFSADIFVEAMQPMRIKLSYADLLSAALILKQENNEFHLFGANLKLGGGEEPDWPKREGLYIKANFESLNWDKIKAYLLESNDKQNISLQGMDIEVNKLELAGQIFNKIRIQVEPSEEQWQIEVRSPEIVGKIVTPVTLSRTGLINANFEKLNIHASNGVGKSFTIKNALPTINFVANQLNYNSVPLGQVIFKSSSVANGQSIDTLKIRSALMQLNANGNWIQRSASDRTELKGSASSTHLSAFLNSFGFDVHNMILNNGKINFNVNWEAMPFSPNLATLNGTAVLDIGPGRIVEVSQTGNAKMDIGRFLSIFSLQSLPRRLSLDFSDIFQKGYSFDFIRGSFTFRNGNTYTNNLQLSGPVARVSINGRIGLTNKDYDLILSVTPFVTSTIPVAATLLTGQPLIGLAALAVNSVIDASKVTTYYYSVKGPWNNPTWRSVQGR